MDNAPFDSSGTDDDLPPSHHNRGPSVQITGNGRTALGALPYSRAQIDMETQIHWLEQEAYCSVLRAFMAQSDAISWDKNDLMTNLRKELRISDVEYIELKSRVDADDIVRRIRERRQAGGSSQSVLLNNARPYDSLASPTISASRKRQKTSRSIPSLPMGAPSSVSHTQPVGPPPSAAALSSGAKVKKPKPGHSLTGVSTMKSLQIPSTNPSGMGQVTNRSTSGAFAKPGGSATNDSLVGRKVMTRWPADNNFYEAEITDYREGLHALVYDRFTDNEAWEWVNLKEISPEDIKWEGEDPGILNQMGRGGSVSGIKKPTGQGGATTGAGRGRGPLKIDLLPTTNGLGKKNADDIEILHTETLIKEVEKVFAASHPDPLEIEKAKKVLKEHEQSLLDVIARLAGPSDGESGESEDDGRQWNQSEDDGRQWNQQGANYVDSVAG